MRNHSIIRILNRYKMAQYKETFKQSPNISSRFIVPKGIILHHTAGSYKGSVSWCLNKASKVSYHCIIDVDGSRTVLAKDNQRAWHAGVSVFQNVTNCNNYMLGVAVNGDTKKRLLTFEEIDSVAKWCVQKMKKYNFGIDNITTHREVSAPRKTDVDIRAEKSIKKRILDLI